MSADERRLELQERIRGNRSNAAIARNTALDLALRLERDITDLRRKLEHDDLEDLADGRTISYSSFFTSDPFNLERNLVRVVHLLGEMKVAQYDLEELDKEAAQPGAPGPEDPVKQYIVHGFIPKEGAWRYCASSYQGRDNEDAECGMPLELHGSLDPAYMECSLARVAHSGHPSPVDGKSSPHGHEFFNPTKVGEGEWYACRYPVRTADRAKSH